MTLQRFKAAIHSISEPVDLMAVVLLFHWEENCNLMNLILEHDKCDRGIALLIYWVCSPWYVYRKVEKGIALDLDMESRLKVIKRIENDFSSGKYPNSIFAIDPAIIFGKPIRDDYPNSPGMRFVPDYMRLATSGEPVVPDVFRKAVFG